MKIKNFKTFCQTLEKCSHSVLWVDEYGNRLHLSTDIIAELHQMYEKQGKYLKIWMEYNNSADYLNLLSCTAWDY